MRILLLFILLFFIRKTYAQDTIYFKNNTRLIAQLIKIDRHGQVFYKTDSIVHIASKKQIRLIACANGDIKIISVRYIDVTCINSLGMFTKGTEDAHKYYKTAGGAAATGVISFLSGGILGLIPAIACSATQPKYRNLNIPDYAPTGNKDYVLGYTVEAKKIKQRKVWSCYSFGIISLIAFSLIVAH